MLGTSVYPLPSPRLPSSCLPRLCGFTSSSLLLIGTDHWPETVAAGALRGSDTFGAEGSLRLLSIGVAATHLHCPEETVLIYSVLCQY